MPRDISEWSREHVLDLPDRPKLHGQKFKLLPVDVDRHQRKRWLIPIVLIVWSIFAAWVNYEVSSISSQRNIVVRLQQTEQSLKAAPSFDPPTLYPVP